MSLKELNGWEKQFIGHTFSKRLEQRLMAEHVERMKREINRRIFEAVVVSVLDKMGCIKDVGLNKPQDLILDNFGTWLGGLIRTPTTDNLSVGLLDDGNVSRSVFVYRACDASGHNTFNALYAGSPSVGSYVKIGSSATAPARGDYTIGTPFEVSPEDNYFGSGTGSYSAGVISFANAITAGGSGTIREVGFFGRWLWGVDPPPNYGTFMLFHDLVSAVGFSAGQTITVAYTINL